MARYICVDDFLEKMKQTPRYFDVKFDIENFPTADVVEVKHGHWNDNIVQLTTVAGVKEDFVLGYKCSLCGRTEMLKEPYCNCGAKMDVPDNGEKGETYEKSKM